MFLLYDSAGNVSDSASYPVASNPLDIIAADFDNDGDNDLAVSVNWASVYDVAIFKNNGDGSFAPCGYSQVPGFASVIAASDFNGDGY